MICGICGRKLKNAKSRELGYEPVCYKRKFGITPHASRRDADVPISTGEAVNYEVPGQISMEEYLLTLSGK